MSEIRFRQPLFIDGRFLRWHYWGYIDDGHGVAFVGPHAPQSGNVCGGESQQYTGLTDKNGNEICEGDVVEWADDGVDEKELAAISWNDKQGCWMWGDCWLCNCSFENKLTVTSTIHENPELVGENE